MQLSIISWNGSTDINNGSTFKAWFETRQNVAPRNADYVERFATWPKLAGTQINEPTFTFKINCLGTIHSQRETIKGYFSAEDFDIGTLVFEDAADSNRQWYLKGMTAKCFEETPGTMVITLALDEPFLRTVVESTGTLTITASGQSTDFTVIGNSNARPTLRITPTSAKTGQYAYKRWVPLYNNLSVPLTNYPYDFGGLDTAALIAGGKMQASGIDYRLTINGVDVDRWLPPSTDSRGINTTDTAMWGIVDLERSYSVTLKTAVPSSDSPTTLDIQDTTSNRDALLRLKDAKNKILYFGTEAFSFTGVAPYIPGYLTVTGVERAVKGTTAATQAVGTRGYWIQHDIWELYGSSDATSDNVEEANDNNKPMFSLSSSNTSWIYTDFHSRASSRPGAWSPQVVDKGVYKRCVNYRADRFTQADPASEMGMALRNGMLGGAWKADNGTVIWRFSNPCGISSVQASLEKYATSTSSWPTTNSGQIAGLQYYNLGVWYDADHQAAPASAATWTAGTIASTDTGLLADNPQVIQFILSGSLSAIADNANYLEISDATLAIASTGVPSGSPGAEQSLYRLDALLSNTQTGESIRLRLPAGVNQTITVDCDEKTVTSTDGTNFRAGLMLSSIRDQWFDWPPGTNTITYTETSASGVTLGVEWENRNTV